jgi:hypothetical protein
MDQFVAATVTWRRRAAIVAANSTNRIGFTNDPLNSSVANALLRG